MYKNWRKYGQILLPLEDAGCGNVEAEPEKDFPEIVRVSRNRPKSRLDEFALEKNTCNVGSCSRAVNKSTLFLGSILKTLFWKSAKTSKSIPIIHIVQPM